MRVSSHLGTASAYQKIEIGALVGLLNMFDVKLYPTSVRTGWRSPYRAACRESGVIDFKTKQSLWNIQRHHVSILNEGERASGSGFR